MATIFESYELTATLAEHSDGSLHEARDRSNNALALLQRPSGGLSIEAGRQRLLRESGVLGQLASVPGVAKVQRLCQGTSGDALVLRYFRGVTLAEFLKSGPPDLGQALAWTIRLAEILDGVHKAGFLHRNLSPEAILVAPWAEDFLLVDFSLASPVSEERRPGGPDPVRDWAYLAPEQTGRFPSPLDRRTDFYALGMLLYRLVAGEAAFQALGPLEAIHAHLAKVPPSPRNSPAPLTDLILKMVAKAPDQRYQSTTGLIADLSLCQEQWKAGKWEPFPLGKEDRADQPQNSRTLFGRDAELEALRAAYDAAAAGSSEIVVLKGPSGVGKTSLASEAGSWALADQGFFLTGKYDDSKRDQPYSAVIQQLEDLVRQILSGPEPASWRRVFSEALKDNQGVVTTLVPAFEEVVGPQPPPAGLPPRETENRFFFTMESFLRALRASRPVVLFFDDIQWIDAASARLLEYLREQRDSSRLVVLYSYRSETGTPAFPAFLEKLEAGVTRPVLTLAPLEATAVKAWLTEVLGTEIRAVETLAQNLCAKTAGSPFFLSQLLRRLHRESVITYDRTARRWDWSSAALAALPASENVSDLLIDQFRSLPPAAGTLLGVAACLGSTIHSGDLALFSDEIPDLAAALWPLIDLQYLVPMSDGYLLLGTAEYRAGSVQIPSFLLRFQHDRIRQAAYAQLNPEIRSRYHLKAARSLEADKPVDAVGHYLTVLDKITAPSDRDHLIRLLIQVGERARASSAIKQALDFFRQARDLSEGRVPDLRPRLLLLLSETAYLCHEIDEAERVGGALLSELGRPEQKAEVFMMQMDSYTFLGRLDEALERGRRALAVLGTSLPLKPNPLTLAGALIKVIAKAGRRTTEKLYQRTKGVPPDVGMRLRLLGKFLVPAQMSGNINLFILSTLRAADLALDHGNSAESSGAFGNFAILLSVLGRHRQAFDYATLAMRLEETTPNPRTAALVHTAYSFYTLPWNRPWSEVPPAARRGADAALRSGDLFFIAYQTLFATVFWPPASLQETVEAVRRSLTVIHPTRQDGATAGAEFALQRWRSLAGELSDPVDFSQGELDEAAVVENWVSQSNASGLAVYYLYKAQVFFHLGRFEEAWQQWQKSLETNQSILGSAYMEEYSVYALLICAEHSEGPRRSAALRHLARERRRLGSWASTQPENFGALWALARAEEASARGSAGSAARNFSKAVTLAGGEAVHVRWKAVIHERAAEFHLVDGDRTLGTYLLRDAYRYYSLWGAREKLRCLERSFPELGLAAGSMAAATPATRAWDGDAASLWKISQVISREMDIDRLLSVVIQAVIENAGARRGWLLLESGEGWQAVARGEADGATQVFAGRTSPESEGISRRILSEVKDEGLLVPSAARDPRFSSDPVVVSRNLRSVLGLRFSPPGSQLRALWYLENDLVDGAFSPERLGGLRLLSGQIGISLENARIYQELTHLNRDLEGKVQERTSELEERNRQFLHSVEYAGVLQRSLLPREWGASVADRFVVWTPKDIVGGDLYWFRDASESCLMALVDCTGHGVPGSLITMLVHSILDDAVAASAPGDLGAVLKKSNQQFRKALGQHLPGSESNDGFDIGLLWWAHTGSEVRFAGARIPLLYTGENGLQWIFGERKGLGYHETPEDLKTTVHSLPRTPGARYYLTSDGFLGQVGGEKDISLGRERFAQLLQKTAGLPMEEQGRALKTAFDDYRGSRPQADDITVLGVQIK